MDDPQEQENVIISKDDSIIEEIVKTLLEELIGKIEFQLDGILNSFINFSNDFKT